MSDHPEIAVWHINYAYHVGGVHWMPAVMVRETHRSAVMEAARMRADARYANVNIEGPFYQKVPG